MGLSAQGATFTFTGSRGSFSGRVVGISVESPVAEVVDMTPHLAAPGQRVMVPTGHWTGGQVTVDFLSTPQTGDIESIVRGIGSLTFASPGLSVTRRVVLESANTEARVGELVRGTATFRVTDYAGT
jgi:hypothetical protein